VRSSGNFPRDLNFRRRDWRKKDKTAFVYFNNDAYGFAVKDALTLKKWMSQDRVIP
jgi:uncharacterized protein YecE (DUF72 family)